MADSHYYTFVDKDTQQELSNDTPWYGRKLFEGVIITVNGGIPYKVDDIDIDSYSEFDEYTDHGSTYNYYYTVKLEKLQFDDSIANQKKSDEELTQYIKDIASTMYASAETVFKYRNPDKWDRIEGEILMDIQNGCISLYEYTNKDIYTRVAGDWIDGIDLTVLMKKLYATSEDKLISRLNGLFYYLHSLSDFKEYFVDICNIHHQAYSGNFIWEGATRPYVIPEGVTTINRQILVDCDESNPAFRLFSKIGLQTFYEIIGVNEVLLPETLIEIEPYTFHKSRLERVSFGKRLKKICEHAFDGCNRLKQLDLPDSVVEIKDNAFIGCVSLKRVSFGKDLKKICESAFSGCLRLIELDLPDNVVEIEDYAFQHCSELRRVSIGKGTVKAGNYAFSRCPKLQELTIPDNIKFWSYAFEKCTALQKINIQSSGVENPTGNFYVFSRCPALSDIVVSDDNPHYDSRNHCNAIIETATNKLVLGCQTTVIPDSVTEIGDNAFSECAKLSSITIPKSVTKIGNRAFSECEGLESVNIPESVTEIGDRAFFGCKNLGKIVIPNSVIKVGERAFCDCKGLTSIPESVIEMGKGAFSRCTGLKSAVIPASATKVVDSLFWGCNGLTSITIPKSVTSIGKGAFYWCRGLTSIVIPKSVQSIGEEAFEECTGLTSIDIPNSVKSIGSSAFKGCTRLTSITIPKSVTSIGDEAFGGCTGLTSIVIPNSIGSIDKRTFYGCTGLTSITIPKSVTSIGDEAFEGCTALTSITIPKSVTSIGDEAFEGCTALTSITIPKSVRSIGRRTFHGCSSLKTSILPAAIGELGEIGREAFPKGMMVTESPLSIHEWIELKKDELWFAPFIIRFLRSYFFKMLMIPVICLIFYYGFQWFHSNDIKPLANLSEYGEGCYDYEKIKGIDTLWAYHFAHAVFMAEDQNPSSKETTEGNSPYSELAKDIGVDEKTLREQMRIMINKDLEKYNIKPLPYPDEDKAANERFKRQAERMNEEELKSYAYALAKEKCLDSAQVEKMMRYAQDEATTEVNRKKEGLSSSRIFFFMRERTSLLYKIVVASFLLLTVLHLFSRKRHKKRES